ncbi:NTF2-like N-terminal transpeptidase domain protein [Rhodococcus sp. MTM3W5.2]|nr:NTF2-like N-terminal transpeptidase domain protein [Rhodococcus sp. MTM3W5.2]
MISTAAPRILSSLVVTGALVLGAVACTPKPDGPEPAAQEFLDAVADRDTERAAALSDKPADARSALDSAWEGLQAESLTATTDSVRVDGDTATVGYTYEWHLPKDRVWTYSGDLQMGRRNGEWAVRWNATDLHPKLGDTQTMTLRATPAPRARVNERAGSDVLVPGTIQRIKFNAKESGNPTAAATALASALEPFDSTLTPQSIVESATSVSGAYLVASLRQEDYDTVAAALSGVSGVSVTEEADLVSTDRDFAPT